MVFLSAGCTAERTYVTDRKAIGPYTPAVRVGHMLFISGQIAIKPGTTELAGDDFETQARQVMENLASLLQKANFNNADVVQCTVYLKNMVDYTKMNQIYSDYFLPGRAPARTAVEVSNLPRNAKIEISAVAYK